MEVQELIFKDLPQGIKVSISRSIKTAFENFMAELNWNDEKFDMQQFILYWQGYAKENSAWNKNIESAILTDAKFHEELAEKINEVIMKVVSEKPTEAQINMLEDLSKRNGLNDIDYSCKAEAQFYIDKFKK